VIDTSPAAARRYRAMLMQHTGAERMAMGLRMFHFSRTLVQAGVRAAYRQSTGIEDMPA
jgi:hypothetical protein